MAERLQLWSLISVKKPMGSDIVGHTHSPIIWPAGAVRFRVWIQPEMEVDLIKNKQTMIKMPQKSEESKEMMVMAVKSIPDACGRKDEHGWVVAPSMSVIFLIQWLPKWMIVILVVQWLLNGGDYILVSLENRYCYRASEPPMLHFELLGTLYVWLLYPIASSQKQTVLWPFLLICIFIKIVSNTVKILLCYILRYILKRVNNYKTS